jgi:hypothetical protein
MGEGTYSQSRRFWESPVTLHPNRTLRTIKYVRFVISKRIGLTNLYKEP